MSSGLTWTSGGARAGAAANSCSECVNTCLKRPQAKFRQRSYQAGVADEFPGEPQEGLLEVVVGFRGDIVVLEVLLAVEGDGLGLDLALLDVDLVTAQHDRDVLAHSDKVTCIDGSDDWTTKNVSCTARLTVPVGDILVGNARRHVEHDDTALAVNVVPIAQTAELLLTGGIPDVELNVSVVLSAPS